MPNLLIIHHGALGDVVLTFPVILILKKIFHSIDILCQGKIGKIAAAFKLINKYYSLESGSFASLYTDTAESGVKNLLRSYDDILLFSYSQTLEQSINRIRGKKAYFIHPRPPVSQSVHVVDYILQYLFTSDILKSKDFKSLSIPLSDLQRKHAHDPKTILLHPGSGSKRKNWHISNFIEVYEQFHSDGMKPKIILGPAEHFLADDLSRYSAVCFRSPDWKQAGNIYTISDLAELVLLLKNADGFIGNDSGITHLAAFMGLATAAVFGPSDPVRWRPVGRAVVVIRPEGLDCSPCFETSKTNCDKPDCLNKTFSETVISEFRRNFLNSVDI